MLFSGGSEAFIFVFKRLDEADGDEGGNVWAAWLSYIFHRCGASAAISNSSSGPTLPHPEIIYGSGHYCRPQLIYAGAYESGHVPRD